MEQLTMTFNPGRSFINTINVSGSDLRKAEADANTQNAKILEVFANNPNIDFTPCEVYQKLSERSWLLQSIRRGITQLTSSGYLVKTDVRRNGIYGKLNYTWRLRK